MMSNTTRILILVEKIVRVITINKQEPKTMIRVNLGEVRDLRMPAAGIPTLV